jgi:hypothetical protein
MDGHLFFHHGDLPSPDPPSDRNSDEVAEVWCSASPSLSDWSSRASRGVISDVRLETPERCDRDERPDLCDVGRELDLVEAHGPSPASMLRGG